MIGAFLYFSTFYLLFMVSASVCFASIKEVDVLPNVHVRIYNDHVLKQTELAIRFQEEEKRYNFYITNNYLTNCIIAVARRDILLEEVIIKHCQSYRINLGLNSIDRPGLCRECSICFVDWRNYPALEHHCLNSEDEIDSIIANVRKVLGDITAMPEFQKIYDEKIYY